MYSEPGNTVMLNSYNGKTDIWLAFYSAENILYNCRDEPQMRQIIYDAFKGVGWRTTELMD
jgi:hypothetical protein